jgi:hypothetical protein
VEHTGGESDPKTNNNGQEFCRKQLSISSARIPEIHLVRYLRYIRLRGISCSLNSTLEADADADSMPLSSSDFFASIWLVR